ncbi:TMEM165/GDT1 family protein [Legionella sp. km772]|uniref:TMEM165/GDT1 family protein n=1 Tax=Legionella sp. km772 TaxID=2498111 RepID=UPI000F8E3757|nr:TMEM165/GDT1 family protein [Legionella sp. km772]RUR12487.1 TMEM165/GDT1 family protein [Legionella sp. km772]
MQAFFTSILIVVLAELGDKTQLLALVLAVRFKKPLPIILAILCATLINHSLAGFIGVWLSYLINPYILRWIVAILFFGMGIWMLFPDHLEEDELSIKNNLGVFSATLIAFFLAEMGDKTQIATIALAAHYQQPLLVITGTTLGMLLADVPAVFIGTFFAKKIPIKWIHRCTALLFAMMGILTLIY